MIIPAININTNRSVFDKVRLCFWAYLLILIFEGAMRKWFLPSLSDLFLVVRDPIVLYVVYLNFKYSLLKNNILKFLYIFSFVTFFLTLLFGHNNIFVAIYGVRITLLHLPSIFIFGKVLTNEDIHLIGKTIMYISILMFIIILLQYFSPSTAWINVGTGGVGTASFVGVSDKYMRPSGTFSFISGLSGFELLVGLYLFYYIKNNRNLAAKYKMNIIVLFVVAITFIFSIVLCLSRTIILQTLILFLTMIGYSFFSKENVTKILYSVLLFVLLFYFLLHIESFRIAIDNVFIRFEQASKSEGDIIQGTFVERYLGSFYRAFFDTQNFSNKEIPFWGFGLGIGTKVGEKILDLPLGDKTFAFAEEEWSRIVCEVGLLQGMIFLLGFRLIYPMILAVNSLKCVYRTKNCFLLMSIFPFLLYIIDYQWSVPMKLGFTVVLSTLFIASYNINKHN